MGKLVRAGETKETLVHVVPPLGSRLWRAIQRVRKEIDDRFCVHLPHVSILKAFVSPVDLDRAEYHLRRAISVCRRQHPMLFSAPIDMSKLDIFSHAKSHSVVILLPQDQITILRDSILEEFPAYDEN